MIEYDSTLPKLVKAPLRIYVESPVISDTAAELQESIQQHRSLCVELMNKTHHMIVSPYTSTLADAMLDGFMPDIDIQWYYERVLYSCDILYLSDTNAEWTNVDHCVTTLDAAQEANMWICTRTSQIPEITPEYEVVQKIRDISKSAISHRKQAFIRPIGKGN